MYSNPSAFLPATGASFYIWMPLAAFALVALGFALVRAARTFGNDDE